MNFEFITLRTIYEKEKVSQRDMAKYLDISLGKVNGIFKTLEDLGYIENKNGIKITDKGIGILKSHKVDAAVILASGKGIKLEPFSIATPKSFIKIKGEYIIERQIEQLLKVGIKDITIVVGYQKEQFDYLIDKYNVRLIYNSEFLEKNNLSSLRQAKNNIIDKNVYVCSSDMYIEENVFHQYECEPYYSSVYLEEMKNEWQIFFNSKKEILSVVEGGDKGYAMLGPAFFTKEFCNIFLKLVESYDKMPQSSKFYWEDVYIRNIDILPTMYAYPQPQNNFYKFFNLNDIKKVDSSYSNGEEFSYEYICSALNVRKEEFSNINCIYKENNLYRYSFNLSQRKTLYMYEVASDRNFENNNTRSEQRIYEKIFQYNISDNLIFLDEKKNRKVTEIFDDIEDYDIYSIENIRKILKAYKDFHNLKIKIPNCYIDPQYKIYDYVDIIKNQDIKIPFKDFDEQIMRLDKIIKYVEEIERPKVLIHYNCKKENIYFVKDKIKFIDFSKSGMADPLCDIASLSINMDLSIEDSVDMLKLYLIADNESQLIKESVTEKELIKLFVSYIAICSMEMSIHATLRCILDNVDYGYFNMRTYRCFKNAIKYLNNYSD